MNVKKLKTTFQSQYGKPILPLPILLEVLLFLGITENVKFVGEANHFEITGITNPQKLRKEFFDTLNSNKVNRNILTDSDVEIIDYEGVLLMCITVPLF